MTTIAPGQGRGPLTGHASAKPLHISRRSAAVVEVDRTHYPDWEPMGRHPIESLIAGKLQAVIARYQASRGLVCYTGSDNFIYWEKGNNKLSVAPDVYILPGIEPDALPMRVAGSNDEGCWKTWLHKVVPSFAIEVKAWKNPRKDELQSPERHDALGTQELIVFDPFLIRRRNERKRFIVYRRNAAGKLVPVVETNERRVYSEVLDGFFVAEGDFEESIVRFAIGPNGETILPFESELVALEAQRADEQSRRADEQSRRADEQAQRAEAALRRAADLEAELERLRSATRKRRKQ